MADALPEKLRSARGWLAGAVLATGGAAWLAVAWATNSSVQYAGHIGVVGISVTLGSAEVAYLAWRNWTTGERRISVSVAATASLASMLILNSAIGGVSAQSFIGLASGVGLLGMATAVGVFGEYRTTGKSTAATLTAMIIMAGLAYFASLLWAAVP